MQDHCLLTLSSADFSSLFSGKYHPEMKKKKKKKKTSFLFQRKTSSHIVRTNARSMKKIKRIFISRPNDNSGGFGFTLRHFVVYPPSISFNDILQVRQISSETKSMLFLLVRHRIALLLMNISKSN